VEREARGDREEGETRRTTTCFIALPHRPCLVRSPLPLVPPSCLAVFPSIGDPDLSTLGYQARCRSLFWRGGVALTPARTDIAHPQTSHAGTLVLRATHDSARAAASWPR
jgi:hypothetical protein